MKNAFIELIVISFNVRISTEKKEQHQIQPTVGANNRK